MEVYERVREICHFSMQKGKPMHFMGVEKSIKCPGFVI